MDPLAQLNDIHLPPEPALWPPAPGWWLLAALLLVALVLAVRIGLQRWRNNAYRRQALAALKSLRQRPDVSLQDVLTLVRRTALTGAGTTPLATLDGPALLTRLNEFSNGQWFSALGIDGTDLNTLLYGAAATHLTDAQREALAPLLHRWLRRHRRADLC